MLIAQVFDELTKMGADIGTNLMDNTAVNPAAARLLKVKWPMVVYLGCCAHGANLLARDLMSHAVDAAGKKICDPLMQDIRDIIGKTRIPVRFEFIAVLAMRYIVLMSGCQGHECMLCRLFEPRMIDTF